MGTVNHDYHSSMTDPVAATPRQRFAIGKSVALVAGIDRGLPKEFDSCDLIYSEIAWEHGYERFLERTGGGVDYATYLTAIGEMTKREPCILICGKKALQTIPTPKTVTAVNLNTGGRFIAEAVAVTYGCALPKVKERHGHWTNIDTENLLHALAKKYKRIGDPCCGYGNTGRIFAEHGREFVLSDSNATCIGRIAEIAPMWTKKGTSK